MKELTVVLGAALAFAAASPAWADTEIEREVHESTESDAAPLGSSRTVEKKTEMESESSLGSSQRTETKREESRTAVGGSTERETHVEEETEIDD